MYEKLGSVALVLVGVLLIGGLFTLLGLSIFSSGKTDYCYVRTYSYANPLQQNVIVYTLVGHVPWRPDRDIANNLKSLEEVKQHATLIDCQIR